ncbi:MarR family winged helix-turn-helix transcriptional regulator [Paenibacillus ginsengarvi]|uniref:MarR family winged helix-turn-helix transcriptional regulator n=1 Tax=Paenibacillus ginsengarvi TaxID=400777 RepID=UPI001F000D35|nr:MarR family transcriptional regulator [Paenibacillus ginsengarvi]
MLNEKKKQLSELYATHITRFVSGFTKILATYDLTDSQYWLLQIVEKEGRKTCSSLAETMDITLSAVTNLSNKLVKKGLIERIVPEHDRRTTFLQITEQGERIIQQMIDRYTVVSEGMWTSFTEEELDLLISSYRKMVTNLEQAANKRDV